MCVCVCVCVCVCIYIYVYLSNYTKMLRAILNKSWRQHPKRHQLYGHLPPITKTIQVRRTRHAGHCWRSKDELISDVLLWTTTYGRSKAGRPSRAYIQQLCEDTGCSPEDLPEAMNDREMWRERVMMRIMMIFKHVSLDYKDKFCLYNLFKILSSFLISVLVSGWNW